MTFDLTERHLTLLRSAVVIWNDVEAGGPVVLYSPQLLDSAAIPYLDVEARAGTSATAPVTAARIADIESLVADLPEALRQLLEHASLQPGARSYVNPLAGWREDLAPRERAELGRASIVELDFTGRHAKLLRELSWRGLAVDAKRPYGESAYFELEMAELLGDAADSGRTAGDDETLPAAQEKELRRLHAETLPALQIFLREAVLAAGRYPRIGGALGRPGAWDGDGYFQPYAHCRSARPDSSSRPALATPSTVASDQDPVALVEAFLRQVAEGDVDRAFAALPKSAIWEKQSQSLDTVREQAKTAVAAYGAFLGLERAREQRFTPSLIRLIYVMKFELHVLVWSLALYRPVAHWQMVALEFRANLGPLA